jgi:uncharacterized protein
VSDEIIKHRGMNVVISDVDRPYFESAARGQLTIQSCTTCDLVRYPTGSHCPRCGSKEWRWQDCSGKGRVYSCLVIVHGVREEFKPPYAIGLVELDDFPDASDPSRKIRLLTNIFGVDGTSNLDHIVADGSLVEAVFEVLAPDLALPQFRIVTTD